MAVTAKRPGVPVWRRWRGWPLLLAIFSLLATGIVGATTLVRPAFPGAEGYGQVARGGRGGVIMQVTTLADSGPGSLRACIDARLPRVCVFRVGGVIRFTSKRPIIRNPYITIAGETAPGGGILLTHAGGPDGLTPLVVKDSHDVIVRHIRVRPDRRGAIRGSNSAFTIENSHNVILDHVSGSWAVDENLGGYGDNDNITVSWSIFAQGVPRHDKCALMASDPQGPQHFSFIANLCAHNGDRNPDANFPVGSCVEIRNNVLYNGQSQFAEIWSSYGGTPVNITGNYFRAGPNTSGRAHAIDTPMVGAIGEPRIFAAGNVVDGRMNGLLQPGAERYLVKRPVCGLKPDRMTARQSYAAVLAAAGAFPRDSFDARIVREVRTRTGAIVRQAGVLPVIAAGVPYPDRDGDGMDDRWEAAHGADPMRPDAWDDPDGDGWGNLEAFLNACHLQQLARGAP